MSYQTKTTVEIGIKSFNVPLKSLKYSINGTVKLDHDIEVLTDTILETFTDLTNNILKDIKPQLTNLSISKKEQLNNILFTYLINLVFFNIKKEIQVNSFCTLTLSK